jgi:hypothetical protein
LVASKKHTLNRSGSRGRAAQDNSLPVTLHTESGRKISLERIGDLPPVVQPDLVRDGRLIEIMPEWHFRIFDLWMVHPGNRDISRPVRLFKEFAVPMARALFPSLPA